MVNPLSGHTNTGLRDGDVIVSPSLTNPYEAFHSNGIIRLEDGAYGAGTRNSIGAGTAGQISAGGSQGQLVVSGGHVMIDGIVYTFAGGAGATHSFIVGTTGNRSGSLPSVHGSVNQDVLVVVYLDSDNTEQHLKYEIGTPATTSTSTPHAPTTFLSTPGSGSNEQHVILGVVRYTMTAGAGSVTTSLSSPEIHDKRYYIRPNPLILHHMTNGAIGNTAAANAIDGRNRKTFDNIFSGVESGNFVASPFGAIWQSHSPDGHSVLYYSAVKSIGGSPARETYRLAPNEVKALTTSAHQVFRFDGPNIWLINAGGNINLNPDTVAPAATFPPGHIIEVKHTGGSNTITFDSAGIGQAITNGKYARFVYTGSAWLALVVV